MNHANYQLDLFYANLPKTIHFRDLTFEEIWKLGIDDSKIIHRLNIYLQGHNRDVAQIVHGTLADGL